MNSKITYRQQFTRCGKQRCLKCKEGPGHGPYWYAYWSEKGHTVSKYMGLHLPRDIEEQQQAGKEAAIEPSASSYNPVLRVYLLGQFRVERWSEGSWKALDNHIWQRRRARALLGCLLSSPRRRLGRERIMQFFWPDLDRDVAANRLNGTVHELRQILEPDNGRLASSKLLRLEQDMLELADETYIWVDAEAFERLMREARAADDTQRTERLLEEAAALYKGSYLLEEMYSEWATSRRDTLQRAWVALLLDLAQMRIEHKALVSAIEVLDRIRSADPTNETALQRLMILLTHLDRRAEAIQMYRQHVETLQRDYESEPLAETRQLYQALCQGDVPDLPISKANSNILCEQTHTAHIRPTSSTSTTPQFLFTRPIFQLSRHNQSTLVGRSMEMDTIHQIMHALEEPVRPGHLHFLLFSGQPGIGKTRLAEELSQEASTRRWTVVWSQAYEQEATLPYQPWIALLHSLLQGIPSEEEHLHLWEAVLALFETASSIHPLLLVLDDLHWADDRSIALLAYLIQHLKDQRVLLVGTYRDEELPPTHKLRMLISDLQREQALTMLQLQPLSQAQVGTMLAHLARDVVQNIQTRVAGNPFFAEVLAAAYTDEAENCSDGNNTRHSLPVAIAALFERRLSRLTSECQRLLGKAAMLGRSFELRQLLPLAPAHNEDTLLDLLEEALCAGLLTEEGTGAQIRYQFWHPLLVSHLHYRKKPLQS
ncbi:MAG: AAA family ATPase [Ktedonobacteraceae bacterium]|nr:AAA family ATPase [Ktedonobacteraceae bacterium]